MQNILRIYESQNLRKKFQFRETEILLSHLKKRTLLPSFTIPTVKQEINT